MYNVHEIWYPHFPCFEDVKCGVRKKYYSIIIYNYYKNCDKKCLGDSLLFLNTILCYSIVTVSHCAPCPTMQQVMR